MTRAYLAVSDEDLSQSVLAVFVFSTYKMHVYKCVFIELPRALFRSVVRKKAS